MSKKIQMSFYDEIVTIPSPATYSKMKQLISNKYFLDMQDVEELVIYYINENLRANIKNEEDYKKFVSFIKESKEKTIQLFLEVSEQSKLYKNEIQQLELVEEKEEKVPEEKSPLEVEKEKEIKHKEHMAQIEKEMAEKQESLKLAIKEKEEEIAKMNEKEDKKDDVLISAVLINKEDLLLPENKNEIKLPEDELPEIPEERSEIKTEIKLPEEEVPEIPEERPENKIEIKSDNKSDSDTKNLIAKIVEESVNKKLERIRANLVRATVQEVSKELNNQSKPKRAFCGVPVKILKPRVVQPVQENKNKNDNENKNEKQTHEGFGCNKCNVFPIVGARYHCTVLHDYDLCETCEDKFDHPHPLIKYKQPVKPPQQKKGPCKRGKGKGPFGIIGALWKEWATLSKEC